MSYYKKTMTREAYNKAYIKGEVDESFLEIREGNLINLECDCCGAHCQPEDTPLKHNCYSTYQDSVCGTCLKPWPIRTSKRLDQ